jgi:hypothetical protein
MLPTAIGSAVRRASPAFFISGTQTFVGMRKAKEEVDLLDFLSGRCGS